MSGNQGDITYDQLDIRSDPNATRTNRVTPQQQPLPARPTKVVKYYFCTRLHHQMHRTDGKTLRFDWGVYRTNDYFDQQYLDEEIFRGNDYVREATQEEINAYNMRVDPKGSITREVTPLIRQAFKEELRAKLQNMTAAGMKAGLSQAQIEALLADDDTDVVGAGTIQGVDAGEPGKVVQAGAAKLSNFKGAMTAKIPNLQGIGNTATMANVSGESNSK